MDPDAGEGYLGSPGDRATAWDLGRGTAARLPGRLSAGGAAFDAAQDREAGSFPPEALNQEPLRVTGLHSGVYTVRVDGASLGTFTNDQLESGINLGLYKTPMSDQAI